MRTCSQRFSLCITQETLLQLNKLLVIVGLPDDEKTTDDFCLEKRRNAVCKRRHGRPFFFFFFLQELSILRRPLLLLFDIQSASWLSRISVETCIKVEYKDSFVHPSSCLLSWAICSPPFLLFALHAIYASFFSSTLKLPQSFSRPDMSTSLSR